MSAFDTAYLFTFEHERGWYDGGQARDPNPTLDGVTQQTYDRFRTLWGKPRESVRHMTQDERVLVYAAYWKDCQADLVPFPAAVAHYAFAFNAGTTSAIKALQRSLGLTDDGMVGPKTKAALNAIDGPVLLPRLLLEQLARYHQIAKAASMRPNLQSWVGRLTDCWAQFRPTASGRP